MVISSPDSDFITFQRNILDKSPQDVRAYWTPERKKAAIPAHRADTGANMAKVPGMTPLKALNWRIIKSGGKMNDKKP